MPNHLHAEIAIAALDAGKDVLLEKPMASTIAECEQILAAVRRTGRVLSVGHEFRISTQWGFIKRLIDGGRDRRTALRQCEPVPLSLPPGLRRLALRPGYRRLLDSRGAGALLRHADVVVRRSGRPGERAGLRQFEGARRRDVRQLLGRHALAGWAVRSRDADPRRLRAPPRRRSGRAGKARYGPGGPAPWIARSRRSTS